MEFWVDIATDESWNVLRELNKKSSFILIGGWACYLYTKNIKSKDIDIITDFESLEKLKLEFNIKKVEHLRKYETKINGVSIDIYVPFYSKLVIPIEDIKNYTKIVEGFKVVAPEVLLIMKQCAEQNRMNSIKGQKDRIDILSLLLSNKINWENYFKLIQKYNIQNYLNRLKKIILTAKIEFKYLNITDPRKIKLIKNKLIQNLK